MIDYYLIQDNVDEAVRSLNKAKRLINEIRGNSSFDRVFIGVFAQIIEEAHRCMDICYDFIGENPVNLGTRTTACDCTELRKKEILILENRIDAFQCKLNSFHIKQ